MPSAITTVALFKTAANIEETNWDVQLTPLVTSVNTWIERYCQRIFLSTVHTETHDGNGRSEIWLNNYPITVAPVITDNGSVIAASSIKTYASSGKIILDGGLVFSVGLQHIVAVYTAGYIVGSYPEDLVQTANQMVQLSWNRIRGAKDGAPGEISSESLMERSVTYAMPTNGDGLPNHIKATLDHYRRWNFR